MSEYTFKTLDNGDVEVTRTYEVHDSLTESETVTDQRLYREIGAYVYRVYPNGTTGQVCDGLASRGNALPSSGNGDLEKLLRAELT